MCAIIDNCLAADVANGNSRVEGALTYLSKGGLIVYNKELLMEYPNKFRSLLLQLSSKGQASLIDSKPLAEKFKKQMKSNDPHVLSLAIESGVRTLCSFDQNLHEDFKNKSLISPKGKVYSGPKSVSVLQGADCLKG